jgi:serine/threonine protein kinase
VSGGDVSASPRAAEAEDEGRALIGQTVGGKYFVRSVLGRGGMGTVYEGVNVQMGRVVALKVLHPKQLKRRESVKRFYQEARAAGAIGHPNICEVYDLGSLEDGCPYLVMERLVGSTLAQHARQSVLPFDAAIDIMIQVLSGLVAAHEKGIVHRDLKPDNIFLSERVGCPPIAKVLDFGVSKVVSAAPAEPRDADLDLTRTGMVMGTPYYMSPEQASGARDLDGRVDLYACGVILYETLTGRRPFLAANYHLLLWNILKTEPPPPSELRPDLPLALESVIARAMARDRAARYATAHEFIAALAHVRANLAQYVSATAPKKARASTPPPPPVAAQQVPPSPPKPAPSAVVARKGGTMPLPQRPMIPGAPRSGPRGFEDVATEIDGLKDFSFASDESEAATTLMKDPAVIQVARAAADALRRAESEPFDPTKTEVTRSPPVPDPYADETQKIDRPRRR